MLIQSWEEYASLPKNQAALLVGGGQHAVHERVAEGSGRPVVATNLAQKLPRVAVPIVYAAVAVARQQQRFGGRQRAVGGRVEEVPVLELGNALVHLHVEYVDDRTLQTGGGDLVAVAHEGERRDGVVHDAAHLRDGRVALRDGVDAHAAVGVAGVDHGLDVVGADHAHALLAADRQQHVGLLHVPHLHLLVLRPRNHLLLGTGPRHRVDAVAVPRERVQLLAALRVVDAHRLVRGTRQQPLPPVVQRHAHEDRLGRVAADRRRWTQVGHVEYLYYAVSPAAGEEVAAVVETQVVHFALMVLDHLLQRRAQYLSSRIDLLTFLRIHLRLRLPLNRPPKNPRLLLHWRGLALRFFRLLIKLLPLLTEVELLGLKFLLLLEQTEFKFVHLVKFFSQQILILHVVGQQNVVVPALGLELLHDGLLVLLDLRQLPLPPLQHRHVVRVAQLQRSDQPAVLQQLPLLLLVLPLQIVDLLQLLLQGVFEPFVLGLQLLQTTQQLHLVPLETGVLEEQGLVRPQTAGLEGQHHGGVAGDDGRVLVVQAGAHLLHLLQQLLRPVRIYLHPIITHPSHPISLPPSLPHYYVAMISDPQGGRWRDGWYNSNSVMSDRNPFACTRTPLRTSPAKPRERLHSHDSPHSHLRALIDSLPPDPAVIRDYITELRSKLLQMRITPRDQPRPKRQPCTRSVEKENQRSSVHSLKKASTHRLMDLQEMRNQVKRNKQHSGERRLATEKQYRYSEEEESTGRELRARSNTEQVMRCSRNPARMYRYSSLKKTPAANQPIITSQKVMPAQPEGHLGDLSTIAAQKETLNFLGDSCVGLKEGLDVPKEKEKKDEKLLDFLEWRTRELKQAWGGGKQGKRKHGLDKLSKIFPKGFFT